VIVGCEGQPSNEPHAIITGRFFVKQTQNGAEKDRNSEDLCCIKKQNRQPPNLPNLTASGKNYLSAPLTDLTMENVVMCDYGNIQIPDKLQRILTMVRGVQD
jgi:hypothetical protein